MFISIICILVIMKGCHSARILAVFPIPSISHQVVFRPYVHELARRGHNVVVITTDPILKPGETQNNLKEIDVGAISYSIWKNHILNNVLPDDVVSLNKLVAEIIIKTTEEQFKTPMVEELIKDKTVKFDLLIYECASRMALFYSSLNNIPIIGISSLGGYFDLFHIMGATDHPIIQPNVLSQRTFNLTMLETLTEVYNFYALNKMYQNQELLERNIVKYIFGPDTPPLNEMKSCIKMLFLNNHPIWDVNRPVPRSVLYLGNLHEKPESPLPVDLKTYLDSSVNGVIYMSFGTNFNTSLFTSDIVKIFRNVFSQLPYDFLLKWNEDFINQPKNVKVSKWLPQSDLLRHPKMKLFITQGGLQSSEEAITAGVPVIGIPLISDQYYNTQQYLYHGIGMKLNVKTLNEEEFLKAIITVVTDESYRQNMMKLRTIMRDQQYSSLEHAVLWTEYILRNGKSANLYGPSANMQWTEYFEIELVIYTLLLFITLNLLLVYFVKYLINNITTKLFKKVKISKMKLP